MVDSNMRTTLTTSAAYLCAPTGLEFLDRFLGGLDSLRSTVQLFHE